MFIIIKSHRTAAAARSFLNALAKAAPFKIRTLLTDNGTEFTDRLFGGRARAPSGAHEFDRLCQALGIEHRLTRPKHPQTNGMVERFNGRLEQVLRTHRFNSAEDLQTTLHRYVWLYNEHLPQKALEHVTPLQALKRWRSSHPQLFSKAVRNRPGPDTYWYVNAFMSESSARSIGFRFTRQVAFCCGLEPLLRIRPCVAFCVKGAIRVLDDFRLNLFADPPRHTYCTGEQAAGRCVTERNAGVGANPEFVSVHIPLRAGNSSMPAGRYPAREFRLASVLGALRGLP